MTSALSMANQGHEVFLVEKDKELGGIARRIHSTLEGLDVQPTCGILQERYINILQYMSTLTRPSRQPQVTSGIS